MTAQPWAEQQAKDIVEAAAAGLADIEELTAAALQAAHAKGEADAIERIAKRFENGREYGDLAARIRQLGGSRG